MVARDPAHSSAGQTAAFAGVIRPHIAQWFVERRLYRRTRQDLAQIVFKICAIRIYAAAACFISMLLTAWLGAFARDVSAHYWRVFKTLDGTALTAVATQAARYQGYLLPVILAWAALLLLTPAGYTISFRVAAVAAGILGYLHFYPPSFFITSRVAALSHWLARFGSHAAISYLILAIAVAYVLLSHAIGVFSRLDDLHRSARRGPRYAPPYLGFTRRLSAVPLILLVLLFVTWAITVVRLAASGTSHPGAETSYALQGALHQSKYLLVLVLISIAVSRITYGRKWLTVAIILTSLYNLAPDFLPFPSYLEISAGRRQLIDIGQAWGANSLWAALFIFVPASVLGTYFVVRLLRLP